MPYWARDLIQSNRYFYKGHAEIAEIAEIDSLLGEQRWRASVIGLNCF